MADPGGGAGTQLRTVSSGKAECFGSAGGVPCGDEAAPSHGKYLSGQLLAAKRRMAHSHRPETAPRTAGETPRPRPQGE